MALPKPTTNSDWTDGAASKVVEPSAAKKLLGWVALERPPFEFFNFLFFNTDEWIKYLESITDETVNARQVIVNAAGNGQFLTLQAAHDDAGTIPGTKILVTSDLSVDATVNISKNDIEIEFRPGFRLLKGGGAPATNFTGMQIQATADRFRGTHLAFGKAGGFFGDAGDLALEIVAGVNDAYLFNTIFGPSNTQNLDDQGTNTAITASQTVAV